MVAAICVYIALAGVVANILNIGINYIHKSILLADFIYNRKYYDQNKIRILVSSEIWNAVSNVAIFFLKGLIF